jgi:hypothetical protein
MQAQDETKFHNVDLDVYARHDLAALAGALESGAMLLSSDLRDGTYRASFELNTQPRDADPAIRAFVALIEQLPPAQRALWDAADRREFSIGIGAGHSPNSFHLNLSPAVLKLATDVEAAIEFVVYAPTPLQ